MIAADLWRMTNEQRLATLVAGHPIDPSALDDSEYRGVSLGLPKVIERLTWQKFRKCFHRDGSQLRGWNVRLVQNGLEGEDKPVARRGTPLTFGHYGVVSCEGYTLPENQGRSLRCSGLMLDYSMGKNPPHLKALRDPIVAVNRDDPSLLLGWSYYDIGFMRGRTPSFFTLERNGPLTFIPT